MSDSSTTDYDTVDYFTDPSLVPDPHPYFDHLRSKCPVVTEPNYGVMAITGFEEATTVLKDTDTYSSCIAVAGPFPPLPFTPEGDDITEQIAAHRPQMPMFEHMVTMDPPDHTNARSLLNRLLTPRRLKENEDFMWRLADQCLDDFIADGKCEFLSAYAKPFSLLVIADMLGVPEEDHEEFRTVLGAPRPGAQVGSLDGDLVASNPLEWLDEKFISYLEDRRKEPRDDVLTALATANYPDGSVPPVIEVVRSATFLFAAGQETTTKLLSASLRVLGDRPDIQQALRDDRSRIPTFVEEALRMDAPVKSQFRLAKKNTTLGDIDVPAGTTMMVCPGAVNRDPVRFEDPHTFSLDRKNVREHIAFGRGVHSCPGGPLARVEGRVSLERILDRMADITIDEEFHGPADDRRYNYEPTFILRGLTDVHIRFKPVR
ncbi:cytochrome [Mycolicibacterium sp. (ex Dasyatis americana)]|uniref:Cytochrome n=1 Tax=Mycobacterium syngnathidarum TaxID=1908205 RepID=A0A1S1K587_9MYCO|nr:MULTISPECIES: cytochrome P450 [Mycobacterium]OFB36972.1 cytochrome [Mycolicibacterium sp. (ex Dasyatis americana)]MCG7609002.1 cytochrome P450 [Mycobacterium sp. CnD-18-1]OHU00005.1 cytochrome [Mycobacterium syngnathidarum]OLT90165.1 cytochrome [Mycobacterium syngnathidarum]TMS49672.1 cytochrome P450 [Mycobacterium sp. DBP42]